MFSDCSATEYTIHVFAKVNGFLLTLASKWEFRRFKLKNCPNIKLELKTNHVTWEMSRFHFENKSCISFVRSFVRTNYISTHVNQLRWRMAWNHSNDVVENALAVRIKPLNVAIDFVLISLSSFFFFTDLSMIYSFRRTQLTYLIPFFSLSFPQVSYPLQISLSFEHNL